MNFVKLRRLAERNEVRVSSYGDSTRNTPYYYDSLRHALGNYFNTFHTQNHLYDFYAASIQKGNTNSSRRLALDENNTVLTIISFERFFELFIKDLLRQTDRRLTYLHPRIQDKNKAFGLIVKIRNGAFNPNKFENKYQLAPFRECIERFYGMVQLYKNRYDDNIVRKFSKVVRKYSFMDSDDNEASFRLLSWYRDRVLHNGNKIPSLWYLDYMVTQRIIPIVKSITDVEKNQLGDSLFYFKTLTDVDVIDKLSEIKYEFKDLRKVKKRDENLVKLLHIGHLKELGRANINMNLFMRMNHATYEYNYTDPKGRGKRFAEAEKAHPNFKEIRKCLCCDEESMVIYRLQINDLFNPGTIKNIGWLKCYTCDYHMRYNAGDPFYFGLSPEKIFDDD